MLLQAKVCEDKKEAIEKLNTVIKNGAALQKLVEMVKAQRGDVNQILSLETLPQAKEVIALKSCDTGYVHDLKALELGVLAMKLGAGRKKKEDTIQHDVGIVLNKKVGDFVEEDSVLAYVHTNTPLEKEWMNDFYACFIIKNEKIEKPKLIEKIIKN